MEAPGGVARGFRGTYEWLGASGDPCGSPRRPGGALHERELFIRAPVRNAGSGPAAGSAWQTGARRRSGAHPPGHGERNDKNRGVEVNRLVFLSSKRRKELIDTMNKKLLLSSLGLGALRMTLLALPD